MHYFAAWTECGCLIGCPHEHKTVPEAVPCIRRAGGYLVAVENGAMRCLNAAEESSFSALLARCSREPHSMIQPGG
jgi:hypothetical protein